MKKAEGKNGAKGWLIALGVFVGLVLIAGIAYAWDVAANQDKIPRAVSVNGVDISAMDRTAAVEKLEDELAGVETEPVSVTSGDLHTELVPSESGLALDNQRAVDNIKEPSLNPFTRLYSFFRSTRDIPVETNVDEAQLQPALERVKKNLSTDPVDGMLELNNGELKVTDPKLGQTVDAGSLHNAVTENWLDSEGVDVDPEEVEPAINDAAIEAMRTGDAAKALDNPITLKAKNNVTATLNKPEISQFTSIEKKDGKLKLAVDTNRAQELLAERSEGADVPGVNAKISFNGNDKQVTPSEDGEIIDWEPTMKDFDKRVTGDDREWDATYKPDPAEFTTEDAKKATFNDTVGEFTTEGYSAASGKNIELVAQEVNGAVVNPGETFSLNGYTGPRGTAQGYVESGIIIDGHSGSAVGGGISQFATTLYNAAYFAGMEDTAHTPHSYYISRYPAGREATLWTGKLDVKFTNSTSHAVLVQAWLDGEQIHVRMWSTKYYDVSITSSDRFNFRPVSTERKSGPGCEPYSGGNPGFDITVTRTRKHDGKALPDDVLTTQYAADNDIVCS